MIKSAEPFTTSHGNPGIVKHIFGNTAIRKKGN
jgi:hypothetical protein